MRSLLVAASICASLVNTGAAAHDEASNYPSRPVRIIVPQSPGASTDLTARIIALRLAEAFKQPVVVENRAGAGTIIGTDLMVRSTPDGHTMLVVAAGITINPIVYKKMPFDVGRDLAPVTQLTRFSNMLVAHPAFAAKTLQDVIAMARAKPGTINYASAGVGSGTHLSMELLKMMTGIELAHIPYIGGGPAAIATMGAQVQLNIGTTAGVLPHVRSGKLRAIAVTAAQRVAAAPEVPTMAESGVAGYEHTPWNGMFAPAKTPRAIIAKMNAEVVRILNLADVRKQFANDGVDTVGSTAEAFAKIVQEELAVWPKVAKVAGIKPLQ
jgi:tripartite-type tricarboxylate transporter receptor subunit TctC